LLMMREDLSKLLLIELVLSHMHGCLACCLEIDVLRSPLRTTTSE
jgi:hypothetical protein